MTEQILVVAAAHNGSIFLKLIADHVNVQLRQAQLAAATVPSSRRCCPGSRPQAPRVTTSP